KPVGLTNMTRRQFCAEGESNVRNHSWLRPSTATAKTIFCPSGEIAMDSTHVVGAVLISRRISGTGVGRLRGNRELRQLQTRDPSMPLPSRQTCFLVQIERL